MIYMNIHNIYFSYYLKGFFLRKKLPFISYLKYETLRGNYVKCKYGNCSINI